MVCIESCGLRAHAVKCSRTLPHRLRSMNPELDSDDEYESEGPAQELVYKQTIIVLWNEKRTSFSL